MCRIPSQLLSLDLNNNTIYERSQLKMYLKTFLEIAKKECRGLTPVKHYLLIPELLEADRQKVQKVYKKFRRYTKSSEGIQRQRFKYYFS